jgi:hypothetical protein
MASTARTAEFLEQAATVAELDVGMLFDRMKNEFINEYSRAALREGLTGKELTTRMENYLLGLSEKPLEETARKSSTVIYNEGRSAEILTEGDDDVVEFVVRSEILEPGRTCTVCQGFVVDPPVIEVGTDEYFEFMPPSKCEGGDNCRGFYIAFPAT